MNIQIDNQGFSFGNRRLIYYLHYYNEYPEYNAPTPGEQFKKIILKWANVLRDSMGPVTYFPYEPDDQGTQCLKAVENDGKLLVERVRARVDGYAMELDKLEEFMTSPHDVVDEETEYIGEFDKGKVITALLNARVLDDSDS